MTEKLISFGPNSAEYTISEEDVALLQGLEKLLPDGSSIIVSDTLGELVPKDGRKVLSIRTVNILDIYKIGRLIHQKIKI